MASPPCTSMILRFLRRLARRMASSSARNVLVIGSNRGIGLRLLQIFISRGWRATGSIRSLTRDDPSVDELRATGAQVLEMDYLDEDSIRQAADRFGPEPLDCLVNCGGVSPQPFEWDGDSGERMVEMFKIMAMGPYFATKYFMPALQRSANPRVVQISSEFGCIGPNERGGFLGYRMAKAALHQQNRTISRAFATGENSVTFLALEPGYLPTRLTDYKGTDDMEKTLPALYEIIERSTLADSGYIFDFEGKRLDF